MRVEHKEQLIPILKLRKDLRLIVISGCSCSGKTFLSKYLFDCFGENGSVVLSLDNYFKESADLDFPINSQGRKVWDVPESYRHQQILNDLVQLLAGKSIESPKYDIAKGQIVSFQTIRPEQLIIFEGLYAIDFANQLNENIFSIFVDTKDTLRLKRRIDRDVREYGVSEDKVIQFWNQKVKPFEYKIKQQKESADIILTEGSG